MKGFFATVEGPDGAGKSTHVRRFYHELRDAGYPVILTREPGGSPGAEEIRRLIVEGEPGRWSPETEMLLFKAARRDHLERTIWPALEAGHIVLSDRFADSTRVYQGATRGDLRYLVDAIHSLVITEEPHLTVIFDVDPAVGAERIRARLEASEVAAQESRFERMGADFPLKLRAGFLALAEEFPERCVVIDGHGTPEEVYERFRAVMLERLVDTLKG